MSEPISTRQLLALSYRANRPQSFATDQSSGASDAMALLARLLEAYKGDSGALKTALKGRLAKGISWDVSEYSDGRAAVWDDIAAILADDRDTINIIIEDGRTRARAAKEATR